MRGQRPDVFLAGLYLPAACRLALYTATALDIEFAHIGHAAKEELIAHIRYAWWEEALEKAFAGSPPPGHPVLEAVAQSGISRERAGALLQAYRDHHPETPANPMEDWGKEIIAAHGAEVAWQKASCIIVTHRQKHGGGRKSWLTLKLLVGGVIPWTRSGERGAGDPQGN